MTIATAARMYAFFLSAACLTACGEANPLAPEAGKAAKLLALTPTSFTSVVGSDPREIPAVIVQDFNGDPVPGIGVSFAIVSGGGQLHHNGKPHDGYVTTSEAGIATMPGWKLGSLVGENKVVAASVSLPTVTFTVTTFPSPYLSPEKLAGDDEVGAPGSMVYMPPRVRVADFYGNPVSGVPVTFNVTTGGGSITGANTVSDSSGHAAVTSWTLGTVGRQEVSATWPNGLKPLVFTAVAVNAVDPLCEIVRALPAGEVVSGDLGQSSCVNAGGRPFDLHSLTVPADSLYTFAISSTSIDSYLEIFDSAGVQIARSDIRNRPAGSSRIDAFLPKGKYTLSATSISPAPNGSYDITWGAGAIAGCDVPVITRNVLVTTRVRTCQATPWNSSDKYRIYLRKEASITLKLGFYDIYLEPSLQVTNASGQVFAHVWNSEYVARDMHLTYVAPADGYYSVIVGDLPESYPYTLILK